MGVCVVPFASSIARAKYSFAPDIYVRFIFDTVCHISEFSHQSHDLGNAVYRSQFHGVIVIFGIE